MTKLILSKTSLSYRTTILLPSHHRLASTAPLPSLRIAPPSRLSLHCTPFHHRGLPSRRAVTSVGQHRHHLHLRSYSDNMKPEDVGLSKDLQFFKPESIVKENPRATYTTIYKCDNFSLCIFFLPTKGVIPLHNHPRMTVFSKLLHGQMHIKSYDWVNPEASHNLLQQPSQLILAKLKADDVYIAPCDTSALYPNTRGNIHEFTTITPCAVLDVHGPPYSKEDVRDCSYYRDHPYDAFLNKEQVYCRLLLY